MKKFILLILLASLFVVSNHPASASSSLKSDSNKDCKVDGIDYSVWLTNYSTTTEQKEARGNFTWEQGDKNVDGADYVVWLNEYQKICTDITPTDTPKSFSIDSSGFITVDGKRFFPIGMYAGNPGTVEKISTTGINTVWLVDNWANASNNHETLRKVEEKGLWAIPMGYGESPDSFDCDLRQKPADYIGPDPQNTAQTIDCTVCNTVGKLCPKSCNYCNTSYIPAYTATVKHFPHILGYTAHDEPGNLLEFFDKRALDRAKETKLADPQRLTFTQDILHCLAEKDLKLGKWIINKNAGIHCKFHDRAINNTWNFFKNSYIDVIGAESGYFEKRANEKMPLWVRDDIQQLIGAIEFFRQESKKKAINAWLQVGGREFDEDRNKDGKIDYFAYTLTLDDIRSMFYAALGHQARGIHFGLWYGDLSTSRGQAVLEKIRTVIQETKNNGILDDFLSNSDVSNKVLSETPGKVDVSAFFSTNNFYLIAVNITEQSVNNFKISFPPLPKNIRGELIGTQNTINLTKGTEKLSLNFSPHQTHVLKITLSCEEMAQFLELDKSAACKM